MGTLELPFIEHDTGDASRGVALILGAGFSKWAVGLPVANELFDFRVDPWGPRDERRLQTVVSLKQEWDKEHPNRLAEEFIAYTLTLTRKNREAMLWYLARRVTEPFVRYSTRFGRQRRETLIVDDMMRAKTGGIAKARELLSAFSWCPMHGVITTNYDMVIEYALGSRGFNYGTRGQVLGGSGLFRLPWRQYPIMLRGIVQVAKIHGSVSWDKHGCYIDGRRGLTGRALIVAPTPEKSAPPELAHVWLVARGILQRARRLVVFGFAFNPYDEAVLELLRSAGKELREVLLVDIFPPVQRARDLWAACSCDHSRTAVEWVESHT